MIRSPEAEYLSSQISAHVARFFSREAAELVERTPIVWCTQDELSLPPESGIYIPVGMRDAVTDPKPYAVAFNGTELSLWDPAQPPGGEWEPIPDRSAPVWCRHRTGALTPAWTLFQTLMDLLTLREEQIDATRDGHGRFVAEMSPRAAAGLLEMPIFNAAVALLVAACDGIQEGAYPNLHLRPGLLRPVAITLSHDNDVLKGNDMWTQGVRLYRVIAPLRRAGRPKLENLWWAARNAVRPDDFYLDNLRGMVDVERMFGYRSSFYFLNGTRGRFGARSGPDRVRMAMRSVPDGWDVGMHYNYDTFLDRERFARQKGDLEEITGRALDTGRAHYLRMDPARTFGFLTESGIRTDESLGYPDRIGYRAGIAGPFQPFDPSEGRSMPLLEVPLVVMDAALVRQYPDDPVAAFRRLVQQLQAIGGCITVLFHPGQFFNPEFASTRMLYRRLLQTAKQAGAVSVPAASWRVPAEAPAVVSAGSLA